MNGRDRVVILKSPTLKWPTALTIDILESRLYWADSKLKSIITSDYNGENIRTIIHSREIIRHPFSMVVFEDKILLSDRDQVGKHVSNYSKFQPNIISMNRFDGSNVEVLFTRLKGPTAIRIYHKQIQREYLNRCTNHTCEQICVPVSSIGKSIFIPYFHLIFKV